MSKLVYDVILFNIRSYLVKCFKILEEFDIKKYFENFYLCFYYFMSEIDD